MSEASPCMLTSKFNKFEFGGSQGTGTREGPSMARTGNWGSHMICDRRPVNKMANTRLNP